MKILLNNNYYLCEDNTETSQIILHLKYKQLKDGKEMDKHEQFYGSWVGALTSVSDDPRFTNSIKTKKDLLEWIEF